MAGFKRFFPFRYKLVVLLFITVFSVASFLGFFQYINMRNNIEENFEQSKKLIHDRTLNMIKNADYVNLLFEKPIEEEARVILNEVRKHYEFNQNIDFDLATFLDGKENFDIYIIDSTNKVVASTDEKELGLDFSGWTDFIGYLDEVREAGEFSTARISLSIIEGDLTKYCYLPSADGKYVLETGSIIKNQDGYLSNVEFDNFEYQIIEENNFVDSILLYDYQGVSYKKDVDGNNIKIDPSNASYFEQALQTMETVKITGTYHNKKAYYEYIPYEIMSARGANERNVVEIIYNDQEVQKSLKSNIEIIILAVIAAAVFTASLGYYMARRIIKPVEEITEGVKQVAAGNLSYDFKIKINDEFSILGNQFNKMTYEIRRLLEERYQFENNLQIKNKEIFNQKEEITALYEETTALNEETTALNEELESLLQQNLNSYFETVKALANALDEKDSYTGGHCERVMEYSRIIALELGLSQQELDDLKFGSILHDIGKIGISEYILNKDGKLTLEEYNEIKKHPEKGNNILKDLNFLNNCRRIINEHHERVDGKGYPNGLMNDQIYFLAKIVCVADAYDAMTSIRPYRKSALNKEQAIEELLNNRGTQFDDRIVDAFIKYLQEKDVR
jgi:putative nucleotidyltransferase with HDIG domain